MKLFKRASNLTLKNLLNTEGHGGLSALKEYCSSINLNIKDNEGALPLVTAVYFCKNKAQLEIFLQCGASVKKTGFDGSNCIHWAASQFRVDLIDLLLRYNADPNLINNEGYNPLHATLLQRHVTDDLRKRFHLPSPPQEYCLTDTMLSLIPHTKDLCNIVEDQSIIEDALEVEDRDLWYSLLEAGATANNEVHIFFSDTMGELYPPILRWCNDIKRLRVLLKAGVNVDSYICDWQDNMEEVMRPDSNIFKGRSDKSLKVTYSNHKTALDICRIKMCKALLIKYGAVTGKIRAKQLGHTQ